MSIVHRGVEQLVARQAHNLEVIRSSRVSATQTTSKCRTRQGLIPYRVLFVFSPFKLVERKWDEK